MSQRPVPKKEEEVDLRKGHLRIPVGQGHNTVMTLKVVMRPVTFKTFAMGGNKLTQTFEKTLD